MDKMGENFLRFLPWLSTDQQRLFPTRAIFNFHLVQTFVLKLLYIDISFLDENSAPGADGDLQLILRT